MPRRTSAPRRSTSKSALQHDGQAPAVQTLIPTATTTHTKEKVEDVIYITLNGLRTAVPRSAPYVNCRQLCSSNSISQNSPVLLLDITAVVQEQQCNGTASRAHNARQRHQLEAEMQRLLAARTQAARERDTERKRRERRRRKSIINLPSSSSSSSSSSGDEEDNSSDDGDTQRERKKNTKKKTVEDYTAEIKVIRRALSQLNQSENAYVEGNDGMSNASGWPTSCVLLLPSVRTGLVAVTEQHHYRTVKFIGEHLCCTATHLQPVVSPMTASPNHSEGTTGNSNRSGDAIAACGARVTRPARVHWANVELAGLLLYLERHPERSADDFLALPPEEAAVLHDEARRSLQLAARET